MNNNIDINNMYIYRIEGLAIGIVKGNSYEDARDKVNRTYLAHNSTYNPEYDEIELERIGKNAWFEDHPSVLEIDELS